VTYWGSTINEAVNAALGFPISPVWNSPPSLAAALTTLYVPLQLVAAGAGAALVCSAGVVVMLWRWCDQAVWRLSATGAPSAGSKLRAIGVLLAIMLAFPCCATLIVGVIRMLYVLPG
jgi:hypothetical protein